ncbi:MAG: efflux RND transporter periplasmic adaptor subunit [Candidatus Kapabacteria bacterium]|nr:efflux RND transporter periplasmic adaptor subunit [Candidatus Kapabacteria bacterium]
MKKIILIILAMTVSFFVIQSCQKIEGTQDTKRTELKKLKEQMKVIQSKIDILEKELEKSPTNNGEYLNVNVQSIQPQTFRRFIEIQGKVESSKAVSLSSKVPGQIIQIFVSNGSSVNRGQLLIQLDDALLQKSQQELLTSLEFANLMYEKQKRLWEQKAGSEVQYLQAKNNKESLEKRLQSLKEQIENCKIYAPFSGVVDEVIPKIGELVSPGLPVVKLTAMSDLKVVADVSEAYLTTIKQGTNVTINFSELDKSLDDKISVVSKAINPINRTFRVEIKIPSGLNSIKPNQLCAVKINDITLENSIVVPINLIRRDENNKEYIYVASENNGKTIVTRKFVKTGLSYNGNIVITEGLNKNDLIITDGSSEVNEGQTIQIASKN